MAKKTIRFDDKTWTEIFLFGFLIAFVWWLIHQWQLRQSQKSQTMPDQFQPTETGENVYSMPALGIPAVSLPKSDSCGCQDCAAGTTSPGVAQIVANTNAALAAMQAGGIVTLRQLVSIGNSENDDKLLQFVAT